MESEQDSMKTLSGAAGKGSGSSMSEAKKQQYMWPSRWSKPSAHGDCGAVSCNNICHPGGVGDAAGRRERL